MQCLEILKAHNALKAVKCLPVPLFSGNVKAGCIQVAGVQADAHTALVLHSVYDVPASHAAVSNGFRNEQARRLQLVLLHEG